LWIPWVFLMTVVTMSALATQSLAEDAQPARFHHVTLNVVDPAKSIQFYSRVFGATPIKFRGVADAAFTEKSFCCSTRSLSPPTAS